MTRSHVLRKIVDQQVGWLISITLSRYLMRMRIINNTVTLSACPRLVGKSPRVLSITIEFLMSESLFYLWHQKLNYDAEARGLLVYWNRTCGQGKYYSAGIWTKKTYCWLAIAELSFCQKFVWHYLTWTGQVVRCLETPLTVRKTCGSIPGLVKSETVSPTARYRCDVSSELC